MLRLPTPRASSASSACSAASYCYDASLRPRSQLGPYERSCPDGHAREEAAPSVGPLTDPAGRLCDPNTRGTSTSSCVLPAEAPSRADRPGLARHRLNHRLSHPDSRCQGDAPCRQSLLCGWRSLERGLSPKALASCLPNTADKLRSARPCTTPHDTHSTSERTGHHATPPHSPRFVSFIRLLGDVADPSWASRSSAQLCRGRP